MPYGSAQLLRLDPALGVRHEQQNEQKYRQADAPRQRLDHLAAVARLAARQVEQGFAQADENQHQDHDNEIFEFHGRPVFDGG